MHLGKGVTVIVSDLRSLHFKGSGYAPVLRSNGHMGLEDGHQDLESMYAKPNKQRSAKPGKNGRHGVPKDSRGIYH